MSLKLWFSKDFISSFSAMLSLLNNHTVNGISNDELNPPTYFLHCRIFLFALHLETISFLFLPPALLGLFQMCFPFFFSSFSLCLETKLVMTFIQNFREANVPLGGRLFLIKLYLWSSCLEPREI